MLKIYSDHVTSHTFDNPWEAPWTVLNRIRDTYLELIANNSCVLIMCVSSYCIREMDPMTESFLQT